MQLIRLGYPVLNFLFTFFGTNTNNSTSLCIFCEIKGKQCWLGLTLILAQRKFDIIICYN